MTASGNASLADAIIDRCAASAGRTPTLAHIAVADHPFRISGAPQVMAGCDHFAAFAARSQPSADAPTIHVACGDDVAAGFPPLPVIDVGRERRPISLGEVVVAVRGDPLILYAVSADRTRGAVWFPSPERRPQWEKVRPLLPVVHAMLRDTPWSVLHAAAVGRGDRTVLLTGGSHAGKTSLSLAALSDGCCFFGDDVVAVSANGGAAPLVARLYDTARLRMPPMAGLEHLAAVGVPSFDDAEHRAELHLTSMLVGHPLSAAITDVVHVERSGAPAPTFRSISRARVISTVTASTLQVTFGDLHHRRTAVSVCAALTPQGFDPGSEVVRAVRTLLT